MPFLKEQMGAAYLAKEDDKGAGVVVPLPKSSLYLREWTPGELSQLWTAGNLTGVIQSNVS